MFLKFIPIEIRKKHITHDINYIQDIIYFIQVLKKCKISIHCQLVLHFVKKKNGNT